MSRPRHAPLSTDASTRTSTPPCTARAPATGSASATPGLTVRVESDAQAPGDEFLAGFGKTARDGLHLKAAAVRETCDVVISNVLVIDAVQGIRKVSIGIREGRIHAIGRAGQPGHPRRRRRRGRHRHLDRLRRGHDRHRGRRRHPRPPAVAAHHGGLARLRRHHDHRPGVRARSGASASTRPGRCGTPSTPSTPGPSTSASSAAVRPPHDAPLVEALAEGGACGFKVHEDMGAHTRALDTALRVAEEHDVQVALHSDGLNECLSVEDTLAVLEGRTIHAFHIEGCGGGHVPNVLKMAGVPNVIGSSTNPTLPFGRDAVAEHYGMIVSRPRPEDRPARATPPWPATGSAPGRWAPRTCCTTSGAIGITSSDAQGMGRAGETVRRTFADGREDEGRARARWRATARRRQRARAALHRQADHQSGHRPRPLPRGRLDREPASSPTSCCGAPSSSAPSRSWSSSPASPPTASTGDPNAATDTCEPLVLGPQFGAHGATAAESLGRLRRPGRRSTSGRRRDADPPPPGRRPRHPRHRPRRPAPQLPHRRGRRRPAHRPRHPRRRPGPLGAGRLRLPRTACTSCERPRLYGTPMSAAADGFRMPAEWAPHERTWMAWPGPNPTFDQRRRSCRGARGLGGRRPRRPPLRAGHRGRRPGPAATGPRAPRRRHRPRRA